MKAIPGNSGLFICLIGFTTNARRIDGNASISMNRPERDLLSKQFHWHDPGPRGASCMMLLFVAMFFIGVAIGTFLP
jgi:hypothetical protein